MRDQAGLTFSSVCDHCVSGRNCDHGTSTSGSSACACSLAGPAKCPECGCECAAWYWGLGFVGPASVRSFLGVGDDENPGYSEYPTTKGQLVVAARSELEDGALSAPDLDWLSRTLPEGTYRDPGEVFVALCPAVSWPGNDPSQLVASLSMNAIATGTRIVVAPDQMALLVGRRGQVLDSFGPGEHVVSRESAPRAAAESRLAAPGFSKTVITATPIFASTRETQITVHRSGRTRSGELFEVRLNATVSIASLAEFLGHAGRRPGGMSTAEASAVVTSILGPTLDQTIATHTASELSGTSPLLHQAIRAGATPGGLRVSAVKVETAGPVSPTDQMAAMLERQRQAMAHLPPEMQARMQAQMATAMERAQAARASRPGGAGTAASVTPPAAGRPSAPVGPTCPACQAPNPPGTKFCGNCGQPFPATHSCPRCGQTSAPGMKFCGNCGGPLS